MPTVLIIGFSYNNLSSTIADIYYAYSYYRNLGYKINICTDILTPINPVDRISLLTSRSVDEHFIPFITTKFDLIKRIVTDRESFLNWFKSIEITPDNKLILYYSGHGVENNIVLPDNTNFSALEFRNSILELCSYNENACILIIIDCCNPHGLYLPFKFNRELKYFYITNYNFVLPQIIVLTSSEPNCVSQATRLESPFTKYFFRHISNRANSYDLTTICNKIDRKIRDHDTINSGQTCTAYSSYPSLLLLWPWTVISEPQFYLNSKISTLMIKCK